MDKCPICEEYKFGEYHKCKPLWYCCSDSDYSDDELSADLMVDEGWKIYAINAEDAVLDFAKRYQCDSYWYPSEMVVFVMDHEEKEIWKYTIHQEAVPSYWVSRDEAPQKIKILESLRKLEGT